MVPREPQSQAANPTAHNPLLLSSILESAPQGVCLLGPDGTLRLINPAGLRLLEIAEAGAILNRSILPLVTEKQRAMFAQFVRHVLGGAADCREISLITADDGERWVEFDAVPLRDPQGNVTDVLSFMRDVARQGQAKQTWLHWEESQEEADAAANRLAHDLNNILGPITMSLNVLKTRFHDPDSRELLEIIETCAARGANLARQLASPERDAEGPEAAVQIDQGARDTTAVPRGRGETVLVIDDDPTMRHITRQTLEAHGYRVVAAADGTEAATLFAQHHSEIAVVLTDMTMPLMDGTATIQVLRRIDPRVKVIVASGLSTMAHLARLNVARFLAKPYTSHALLAALAEVLQDHRDDGATRPPSQQHAT